MNSMTKLLTLSLLALSSSVAHAVTAGWYQVTGDLYEPELSSGGRDFDTVFTGTFYMDAGGNVSDLAGWMNSSMEYPPSSPNLYLAQDLITSVSGSTVTATIFLNDSTTVFGTYDAATGYYDTASGYVPTASNKFAYTSANPGDAAFGNAAFSFQFDDSTMSGILTNMFYDDCSVMGMMGAECMTGWGTPNSIGRGGGTMGAYPLALSIAPVPLPAAAWLFLGGVLVLLGAGRRNAVI